MSENDWHEYSLMDLARYHNGYAFKPTDWSEDGTKIIRIEQLNNPNRLYDHYSGSIPRANAIENGDLIFSWSATLKVAIWRYGPAVLNQHLFKVDETELIEKHYLFYLLDHHMRALSGDSHGSTMKHIKRSTLQKFRVRIPDRKHQKKRVEILASIDRAIEKTEALIEKYQKVKAGLMHDLFTRGIGKDDKLRPPRSEAPELYKHTPIGWLPKEWEVVALRKLLIGQPKNGNSPKEADEWQGGYVLGLGCLTKDGFQPAQLKNAPRSSLSQSVTLHPGDFLMSRSNTAELVGLCGLYTDIGETVIYPDLMMRLPLRLDLVDGRFLERFMLFDRTRVRISAAAVGTSASMVKLNATSVMRLEIALPNMQEQKSLVARSAAVAEALTALKRRVAKLKAQKIGLMQDLLTGKVEVTVDAPEAANV